MPILSWCLFDADCPHANVLPTLHSGLGLLAMGNCSSTRQVLSCFPQLACDVERHALYLSLLLPFAIVHFLARFCKKRWFLLLQPSCWLRHAFFSSHSCFVLRNAWHKPVKTIDHCDLWVLWSSLHINCAYPFFIFFPYIWLYHLASGDTVQVPCLSENSPSFTCHILSSHMHKSLRNNANMRDAHLAFDLFACSMSS